MKTIHEAAKAVLEAYGAPNPGPSEMLSQMRVSDWEAGLSVAIDELREAVALPAGPVPLTKDQHEAIEGGIRALRMRSDGWISRMYRRELQGMLDASVPAMPPHDPKHDQSSVSDEGMTLEEAMRRASEYESRNVVNTSFVVARTLRKALLSPPAVAQPVADERDAERLEWVSHAWGGQRHDYANHVLSRGGDGDLSDIRTFIDKHLPDRAALCQPAEEGGKS